MSENKQKSDKVGAVWVKTGTRGEYLSIELELGGKKHKFMGWKNDYKTEDKHPTYILFPPREQGAAPVKPETKPKTQKPPTPAPEEDLL